MIVKPAEDLLTFAKDNFPDQRIAFAASYRNSIRWGLSIVVADEQGHHRIADHMATGTDQEMHSLANHLNKLLGLTEDQATFYVASSMRGSLRHATQ